MRRILCFILALILAASLLIVPAFASTWYDPDPIVSSSTLTLNDGSVLSVPSQAITGNFIVYRVRVGTLIYFYIDNFVSTDGVTEFSTQSFTRYRTAAGSWTVAGALQSEDWVYYSHTDVVYQLSSGLFTKPVYSTFDYYDATGNLIIKGAGSSLPGDRGEFEGTIEITLYDGTVIEVPRRLQNREFFVVDPQGAGQNAQYEIYDFGASADGVFIGAVCDFNLWSWHQSWYPVPSSMPAKLANSNLIFKFMVFLDDGSYELWGLGDFPYRNADGRLSLNITNGTRMLRYYFRSNRTYWFDETEYTVTKDGVWVFDGELVWANFTIDGFVSASEYGNGGELSFEYLHYADTVLGFDGEVVFSTFDLYGSDGEEVAPDDSDDVVPPDYLVCNHSYTYETVKEATCISVGERKYTCSICGDEYVEDIPIQEHAFSFSALKEATCTESGFGLYTCSGCGTEYTEKVDPLGHDWLEQETIDTTYALPDETSCPDCAGTEFSSELDEIAGDYVCICSGCGTEWEVDAVINYGETHYVCSVCGATRTESLDPDNGLFTAIGDLLADAVTWVTDKLAQLVDSLSGLIDSFQEYMEQIKGSGGEYPAFLAAFVAMLPEDLMAVLWFALIAVLVLAVWKKWFS